MNTKIGQVLSEVIQLACIAGLAGIALKRNNDCYKAQCELIDEQHKHALTKLNGIYNEVKVVNLEKELEELKAQMEES